MTETTVSTQPTTPTIDELIDKLPDNFPGAVDMIKQDIVHLFNRERGTQAKGAHFGRSSGARIPWKRQRACLQYQVAAFRRAPDLSIYEDGRQQPVDSDQED